MLPVPRPHMTFVAALTLGCPTGVWKKDSFFSEMIKNDIFQVWNHQEEDFKADIGAIDSTN